MNQHKDLLYRQKYATYQLNNRTFSTQNTKISARSLAISYICFQVRIVKKKRKKKPYYQLLRKIWWLPHPRPRQGLYTRNCNGRNYSFYHSWRPSWRPLFAENSRASGGSAPWAPGRGPKAGPWTPPVWCARGALRARIFPPTPFFLQILDPPLYTSPLARPIRLPPPLWRGMPGTPLYTPSPHLKYWRIYPLRKEKGHHYFKLFVTWQAKKKVFRSKLLPFQRKLQSSWGSSKIPPPKNSPAPRLPRVWIEELRKSIYSEGNCFIA